MHATSAEEMFGSLLLSGTHVAAIVRAAESAMEVRRRHQFFIWAQSNLQVLLPHQLLVCGAYQRQRRELQFETFNNVSVPDPLLLSLSDGRSALMQQLQGNWLEARCKPVAIGVAQLAGTALTPMREELLLSGFDELTVHGVSRPQRPSEIESFFIFATANQQFSAQQRLYMALLMPHLHSTWQRVQVNEREINDSPAASQSNQPRAARSAGPGGITERERQILSWLREGMSNQQIGEVLGISALTVKNHVQKILRKLGAANRAQAVARAMSMNLLGRSPSDPDPDAMAASA